MRVTIHFDFKPSVTITGCEVTLVAFKEGYILIKTTEESEWDMLLDGVSLGIEEDAKKMITRLYNDGTCSMQETDSCMPGCFKVAGMSAFEASDKEFND